MIDITLKYEELRFVDVMIVLVGKDGKTEFEDLDRQREEYRMKINKKVLQIENRRQRNWLSIVLNGGDSASEAFQVCGKNCYKICVLSLIHI